VAAIEKEVRKHGALLPDVEDQQALVLNIGQQEAGWKRKIGSVPNASQGAKGV
jgi:hypothetical protein